MQTYVRHKLHNEWGRYIFPERDTRSHDIRNGEPLPAFHQVSDNRTAPQVFTYGPAASPEVAFRDLYLSLNSINLSQGVRIHRGLSRCICHHHLIIPHFVAK